MLPSRRAKVLGKKGVEVGLSDRLSAAQFADLWRGLGLPLPVSVAGALFNKYGQDAGGRLPVTVFAESLLMGAPRLVMMADEVQAGAYVKGRPATHRGKIKYPECKCGVFPPTDWAPRLAERSAALPDAQLALAFVHGYDGHASTSANLFYAPSGEVVYPAAGVVVVFDAARHSQRFFLGHDDDVLCLALSPDGALAASGQVGKDPRVLVWDVASCAPRARLQMGYGYRGVQAVAFSPNGRRIAAIGTDNSHTLFLWDWATGQQLYAGKTAPGAPPNVYGVVWSPFDGSRLVTYGQNHIKFGAVATDRAGAVSVELRAGTYGASGTHTVLAACFLPSGTVLTGNAEGQICVWRGGKLVREVPAHGKGAPQHRPDGGVSHSGVRCLVLRSDQRVLLSGGADGCASGRGSAARAQGCSRRDGGGGGAGGDFAALRICAISPYFKHPCPSPHSTIATAGWSSSGTCRPATLAPRCSASRSWRRSRSAACRRRRCARWPASRAARSSSPAPATATCGRWTPTRGCWCSGSRATCTGWP